MPQLTKILIADQVLYQLAGGIPGVAFPIKPQDVIKAAEQKINTDFKMQYLTTTLPSGETIPEFTMIGTYENVALTAYMNDQKCIATLPVMPISLPRNMGVWNIYSPDYPQNTFIPLRPQQAILLRSQPLINDLLGQIGYTPNGNKVIFEVNLLLLGISSLTFELLVSDFSKYSDTDYLNLPSDYERGLIEYLVQFFSPMRQSDKAVDAYSEQVNPMTK